jgi:hypothetical protein
MGMTGGGAALGGGRDASIARRALLWN